MPATLVKVAELNLVFASTSHGVPLLVSLPALRGGVRPTPAHLVLATRSSRMGLLGSVYVLKELPPTSGWFAAFAAMKDILNYCSSCVNKILNNCS